MTKRAEVGRKRRWGLGIILALCLWGTGRTVEFYQQHWAVVTHLPAIEAAFLDRRHVPTVTVNQVSPWFVKALIATEDRTFYTNLGISVRGIARSLWVDLSTGQFTEGGSTLTQQLVRDRLLTPQKTVRRKLREALLALAVTALYSKRTILTLYLNQVYLGQGYWGVEAAAEGYFGKTARQLTMNQAALLAGLPQAPSALDPFVHENAARRREWVVLDNLVDVHAVSPEQAIRAFRSPLGLRRPRRPTMLDPA